MACLYFVVNPKTQKKCIFFSVYLFVYKTIDVLCTKAIPNHKKNTIQRALDGVGQR